MSSIQAVNLTDWEVRGIIMILVSGAIMVSPAIVLAINSSAGNLLGPLYLTSMILLVTGLVLLQESKPVEKPGKVANNKEVAVQKEL